MAPDSEITDSYFKIEAELILVVFRALVYLVVGHQVFA